MAANTVAVQGLNQATGANGHGVVGQATTGYGVLGYTTGGSASLAGISDHRNSPAFAGGNSVAGGLAASFTGTVFVNGRLVVTDPANKNGLLKHPDGSHRLVYCVESPESWIEDFGKGQLTNGRADVKLDPDFAATVQTEDYAVFLTPYGALSALRVAAQRADGFTVEEIGGASSGAFRYRVVAKPKTDTKAARLAKFEMPQGSALPAVSDLPKPPEAPKDPPKK
jgi:hypothetical protein